MRLQPLLLLPVLLLTGCADSEIKPQSKDIFAMDTYMTVKVWSADSSLPDRAETEISRLEGIFSVNLDGSDVSRINTAHGEAVTVSPDTAAVMAEGLRIGNESGGALDISLYPVSKLWGFTQPEQHVPEPDALQDALQAVDFTKILQNGTTVTVPDGTELDLGALAKGYTGDRIIELFRESGAESAIIALGGNVQTLGTKPDGSLWTVGIANPFAPNETLCSIRAGECAVITSGNYERYFEENGNRYHHILDPSTGFPAENGLVSVTVVGECGLISDALSTALFVEGKDNAIAHWQKRQNFGMLLITDEPAVYYTPDLNPDIPSDIPAQEISP